MSNKAGTRAVFHCMMFMIRKNDLTWWMHPLEENWSIRGCLEALLVKRKRSNAQRKTKRVIRKKMTSQTSWIL